MTATLFRNCAKTDTHPSTAAEAHPAASSHTGHAHKAHHPHKAGGGHATPHIAAHPGLPNVNFRLP